jgi:transcriptional regulator with XRE-family HTH domain
MVAMFADMLAEDRRRRGFTVGQVAWRLGVSPQEYRELEAGTGLPTFDTWDAICKLYGWSQSFVGSAHITESATTSRADRRR